MTDVQSLPPVHMSNSHTLSTESTTDDKGRIPGRVGFSIKYPLSMLFEVNEIVQYYMIRHCKTHT